MKSIPIANTYLHNGLAVIPRLLAHLNRNPLSGDEGVFGRAHWAWKTAPFPDASLAYGLRPMAQAYALEHEDNRFYGNGQLLQYIADGLTAWARLQHPDGSFDQVFPHDHSFGATAYTTSAVLDVLDLLDGKLDRAVVAVLEPSIAGAGEFLLGNSEAYAAIANHLALFAVTFEQLHQYTGDGAYQKRAKETIESIFALYSDEGWFAEYGGADPGYQTQCLHYLARLLNAGYTELEGVVHTAVTQFMPCFVHPDGSLGGHYGARMTNIVYPAGIATLAKRMPEAAAMLRLLRQGVENGTTPLPAWLDLPNAMRLASNYLDAATSLEGSSIADPPANLLPCQKERVSKTFEKAGIHIRGTSAYYAVVGLNNGGVITAFDRRTGCKVVDDRGYAAEGPGGSLCSMSVGNSTWRAHEDALTVSAGFTRPSLMGVTPLKHVSLLLAGLTLFRFKAIREAVKKLLVRLLIKSNKPEKGELERTISFTDDAITVQDSVKGLGDPAQLRRLSSGTPMHMASAEYYDLSGLSLSGRPERVDLPGQKTWTFSAGNVREQDTPPRKRIAVFCDNSEAASAAVNILIRELRDHELFIVEEHLGNASRHAFQTFWTILRKRGVFKALDIVALKILHGVTAIPRARAFKAYTPDVIVNNINDAAVVRAVHAFSPDMILVNRTSILSPETLKAVHCPILNNHPGITPRYRGVGSLFALAEKRFNLVGATVHRIDEGIDTGEILGQSLLDLKEEGLPFSRLENRLMEIGANLMVGYVRQRDMPGIDYAAAMESRLYLRAGLSDVFAARKAYRFFMKHASPKGKP